MEEKAIAKSDEIYLDLIGQMEEEKEDEERKKQHKEVFADLLARLSGVAAKSPNEEDIRARNVSEIEQIDYSLTNTVCYFLKGSSNHIDMIIGIDDYSKLIKKFPKSEFDIRISYKDDDLHIKPFWVEIVNKTTHTRLDVIVVYKSDKTFLKLSNQYMGKGTFDGNKIKLIPILPVESIYSMYLIFQDKYHKAYLDKKVDQVKKDMFDIGIYYRDIFKQFIDSVETTNEVKRKIYSLMI